MTTNISAPLFPFNIEKKYVTNVHTVTLDTVLATFAETTYLILAIFPATAQVRRIKISTLTPKPQSLNQIDIAGDATNVSFSMNENKKLVVNFPDYDFAQIVIYQLC